MKTVQERWLELEEAWAKESQASRRGRSTKQMPDKEKRELLRMREEFGYGYRGEQGG